MYKKCEEILNKLQYEGKIKISNYQFPPKQELKLKLKDMLEDEVDEKYYLSERTINFFYKNEQIQKEKGNGFRFGVSDGNVIAKAVTTRAGGRMDDNFINEVKRKYGVFDSETTKHQAGSVYDENGLSPTLDTMQGGYRQPCIEIKEATKQGYKTAYEGDGVNISSRMKYQRGNVQKESIQTLTTSGGNDRGVVVDKLPGAYGRDFGSKGKIQNKKYCDTLTASMGTGGGNVPIFQNNLRIRKLTPKECWRLMGFDDSDCEKASKVNSNTQLYKQAGNSIVVNVLEAILTNLLITCQKNQNML